MKALNLHLASVLRELLIQRPIILDLRCCWEIRACFSASYVAVT